MLRAFSTSATGMTAQQNIVDVIANNLANINTTGFKRSQVDFHDLMYVKMEEAGREVQAGAIAPSGLEIGSGVRTASTVKVLTQGELDNTGRALDVSIQGDGFFTVVLANGTTRYTRDGAFQVDASGRLVTSAGHVVQPSITIPRGERVSIGTDGTVLTFQGESTTPNNQGQLTMVQFANPAGLASEGGNLYSETPASGSAASGTPGSGGFGSLQSGFLEKSNVQMVTELVNLIRAQRAYEINSRAIKAGDEMLTTANRMLG